MPSPCSHTTSQTSCLPYLDWQQSLFGFLKCYCILMLLNKRIVTNIYIQKNWSSTKYTFYKWMHLYKTTYADMIIIWKYCVKSQMLTNQINIILDFLDLLKYHLSNKNYLDKRSYTDEHTWETLATWMLNNFINSAGVNFYF